MDKNKIEEVTKQLKKMKEENTIEDEWENANKKSGLGYKLNKNILNKEPKNIYNPHKNFYKLEGTEFNLLDHRKPKSVKSLKIQSKKIKKLDTKKNNSIKFVKREKRENKNSKQIGKGKKIF